MPEYLILKFTLKIGKIQKNRKRKGKKIEQCFVSVKQSNTEFLKVDLINNINKN